MTRAGQTLAIDGDGGDVGETHGRRDYTGPAHLIPFRRDCFVAPSEEKLLPGDNGKIPTLCAYCGKRWLGFHAHGAMGFACCCGHSEFEGAVPWAPRYANADSPLWYRRWRLGRAIRRATMNGRETYQGRALRWEKLALDATVV